MDFAFHDDHLALQDAVRTLLDRRAGPTRAREVADADGHDAELWRDLDDAGFLDVALDGEAGPLGAALVVAAVSRAAGSIPVGVRALVVPALTGEPVAGPVAVAVEGERMPVRFGAQARSLVVVGPRRARLRTLGPGEASPVPSRCGYPLARVPTDGGDPLGEGSADCARRWWRTAIAAETIGAMDAAFSLTISYLKDRQQFGRSIASFQAVQHRLAEAAVSVEGSRWLVNQAAWTGARAEEAAAAAAYATATARKLVPELHQLTGAMGFTIEYDLHLWTMRLHALRVELDGVEGHARALAEARWS